MTALAITAALALGEWVLGCFGVALTVHAAAHGDLVSLGNGGLAFMAAYSMRWLAAERRADPVPLSQTLPHWDLAPGNDNGGVDARR